MNLPAQAAPPMKRLLLFLLLATLAHADRPPEWLRLPAANEPRPSEASAWILENSERIAEADANTIVDRYRYAVMPLSEVAVNDAVCNISYTDGADKLVSARAWAMSPDGKKCRAFGGDDFIIVSPRVNNEIWDQEKTVYFKAKRYLQPGWVFAWEVEIRHQTVAYDFSWSPRGTLPVRFSSFEVIPEEGGAVKWQAFSNDLPAPIAGSAPGSLAWQINNLPGFNPNTPSRMEPNSMELRACLLEPAPGRPASKSWSDVVRLARAEMDPKAVATSALTAQAQRLAGTGSLWSRIEPVCKFVQKQITYLEVTIDKDSMAGYRPHAAGEVFENRYGDCKDKAVLLCTLLHSIGVEARVMLVNSGAPRRNLPSWPSAFFNHAIVAIQYREGEDPRPSWTVVHSGNHDYAVFDPTDDRVPFGLLPIDDAGGLGLILASEVTAPVSIPMPSPAAESVSITVSTVLAANGSAKIETSEESSGLAAADAITRDETESRRERTGTLERRIQRRIPLISDLSWNSTGNSQTRQWSNHVSFSAQFLAKRTVSGMYVDTDLMSAVPSAEPWEEGMDGWLTFAPLSTRRDIRLTPPAGWTFIEVPADWSAKTAAGEGSMHYSLNDGVLQGEIKLQIIGGVLNREAYLDLRKLLHAAAVAERRPAVLRKPAPAPVGTGPSPVSTKSPSS
jgi:transglutaminase-like putative cysteine protease